MLAGAALHATLLAVPWLWARDPTALGVLATWIVGSTAEGVLADESSQRIPTFERGRAGALLVTLAICLAFPDSGHPLGLLGIAFGFVLRVGSIRALGSNFSVGLRRQGPRVATGPYRWLQHPSEVGLLVAMGGVVVGTGSLPGAALAVVLVVAPSLYRMWREDESRVQGDPG